MHVARQDNLVLLTVEGSKDLRDPNDEFRLDNLANNL
jgi:hypothetical protein